MFKELTSEYYIILILTSVLAGTIARLLTLVVDYRQYPTYPNGCIIHLVTGFVASAIGAIAVPAVMSKDFEAVTFLALATEQFREVRRIEKESLQSLDDVELVFRGEAYIDGISKTFESRNYISLLVAFTTSLIMELVQLRIIWFSVIISFSAGMTVFYFLRLFSAGKNVGNIAEVKIGTIKVINSELYVDDIFVTNHIGSDSARELVEKDGIAAVIYPREQYYRIVLDHNGQRQAILFEACKALGVKRYHFTSRDYNGGRVVIVLVPIIKDEHVLLETLKRTPLLESISKSFDIAGKSFLSRLIRKEK